MGDKVSLLWLRRLICLAVVGSYIVAAVSLVSTGIVPLRYLAIGAAVYGVVVLVFIWASLRSKLTIRNTILIIIVGLVLSIGAVWVTAIDRTTTSFLSAVQRPNVAYVEYSIIAKSDSDVSLGSASSIGFISSEPLYTEAKAGAAQLTSATPADHGDLSGIVDALTARSSDLASIRSASLEILKENDRAFYDTIVVLGTYKVKAGETPVNQATLDKPFAVYISGIDTYGDISAVSRSDVNMIAAVNPTTHKILLVNTPRDYYVQLHGTTGTPDKLTHAGIYGIDMSRATLEDLYGIKIEHYIRVNFTSLVNVVDAMGGIEVYSDHTFKSFQQGYNTLDGKRALEFSRERYSFQDGDRQRGKNQQRVIEAIIAKMSSSGTIVNYQSIMNSLGAAVQTDISQQSLAAIANKQLDTMQHWQTESISVDGSGATQPTYSMGALPLYVMIPDEGSVAMARATMRDYLKE